MMSSFSGTRNLLTFFFINEEPSEKTFSSKNDTSVDCKRVGADSERETTCQKSRENASIRIQSSKLSTKFI